MRMTASQSLFKRVSRGERISRADILEMLCSQDILSLGSMAAELAIEKNKDRPGVITYIIDRNINYSNICVCKCAFCAFFRKEGEENAYLLAWDAIKNKIEETLAMGGVQILLQGGLHPGLKIDYYTDLLSRIKGHFPQIHLHAFSPPEIIHIARLSRLSVRQALVALRKTGLGSIPGGGAEVLSDRVRSEISPAKCTTAEWLEVMEIAHNLGIRSSATMMFGHRETDADIADHLLALRELQDKTGGFTAFIPWTFQPANTRLKTARFIGSFDYLRLVAVSRIALDNFNHIQASWVTQGPKIAQMALCFGADDMGSTMIEENVVRAAGVSFRMSPEEICRLVQDLSLRPVRRRNDYSLLE